MVFLLLALQFSQRQWQQKLEQFPLLYRALAEDLRTTDGNQLPHHHRLSARCHLFGRRRLSSCLLGWQWRFTFDAIHNKPTLKKPFLFLTQCAGCVLGISFIFKYVSCLIWYCSRKLLNTIISGSRSSCCWLLLVSSRVKNVRK